jgi:hypothetical protein
MNNNDRLYVVNGPDSSHLVKAKSQAQAINAIVGDIYVAKPATAIEAAELVGGGAKVIDATAKEEQPVG